MRLLLSSIALGVAALSPVSGLALTEGAAPAADHSVLFEGRDQFRDVCRVELTLNSDNQLQSLSLSGRFVGPAVLALPHGDDQPASVTDQLTFDSRFNSWTSPQTAATDSGATVTAHGPSIWHIATDASVVDHQLTLAPSLAAPVSVHYTSQQTYGYGRNWVGTVELNCGLLHAVVSGH